MTTDMKSLQAVVSQAQKRAGLESIALISSMGMPIASVGVGLDIGVRGRTIFSVFDNVSAQMALGATEHICIDGSTRSLIVKPLRKGERLHSWFVALAPTFGRTGVFAPERMGRAVVLTEVGLQPGQSPPEGTDETTLLTSVMALWSGVAVLEGQVSLGDVQAVQLDGTDKRMVVVSERDRWLVYLGPAQRRTGRVDVELDRISIAVAELL